MSNSWGDGTKQVVRAAFIGWLSVMVMVALILGIMAWTH